MADAGKGYVTKTETPGDAAGAAEWIRKAGEQGTPVYAVGGGTSLDYGLTPTTPGLGLSLQGMNRVVEYPARDMTITVEAGVTWAELAKTLAAEGQWLPIDAPQADRATVGGVLSANASGPRRFGQGTMRDYVIGVSAVDGRGVAFKGGGRVVKNVAGYDLCKLLTGSLGTLAVVTQVTLKVKPRPEASAFLLLPLAWRTSAGDDAVEPVLAGLIDSRTSPTAVELLSGPAWRDAPGVQELLPDSGPNAGTVLAVGLEGTQVEVDWMLDQLEREFQPFGSPRRLLGEEAADLWRRCTEFPAEPAAPLVVKIGVRPSAVTAFCAKALKIDPQASLLAHAGDGLLIARFPSFTANDVLPKLVGDLQPAAAAVDGHVVVLSHQLPGVWTRRSLWGASGNELSTMQSIKQQFDPHGILNPGRFVFP